MRIINYYDKLLVSIFQQAILTTMITQERDFQKQFIQKGIIGSGTFGQVKKCLWAKKNLVCAVKSISNVNLINIEKIEQEAAIMKSVQSDYSLQLYDHFYEQKLGQYFFIMPFCKLGSIQKLIKNDWNHDELLKFLHQIVQGFIDISQKQIMHLDLKPENILLKAPGEYLVCDFGCSKVIKQLALSKNWLSLSISKGVGTLEYAAPEIIMENKANKYSDIWSLGVILYQMIYHTSPFKHPGMEFGASKANFSGHKPELQPVITLLKKMLNKGNRPTWRELKTLIYYILKIDDEVEIVTSIPEFRQYVNNLSVVGTCLIHHIDRIRDILDTCQISYKPMLKLFLYFLFELTKQKSDLNMFYMFESTRVHFKAQFTNSILHINHQIKNILDDSEIQVLTEKKNSLLNLKSKLVEQTKAFSEAINEMPDEFKKTLQKTPEFEFFKVKKIVEFVSTQFGNNLNYSKKKGLKQIVKYLVYA